MPAFKTHERINAIILCGIVVGLVYYCIDMWYASAFIIAYLLGTFLITPDLDLDSRIYKRWSVFKILWCPYKEVFKHRQTSHHIVFGPISLILYFATLIYIPIYILKIDIPIPINYIYIVIMGIFVAIELHIFTDFIFTLFKLKKKRKK